LRQRTVQPRRAGRRADPEETCSDVAVQPEQDPQRDHLALAGGQARERALEPRREPAAEHLLVLDRFAHGIEILPPAAPLLGAEVVERAGAGDLAEPRLRARALRVEPLPRAERLLEGLGRQVLRERPLAGPVGA